MPEWKSSYINEPFLTSMAKLKQIDWRYIDKIEIGTVVSASRRVTDPTHYNFPIGIVTSVSENKEDAEVLIAPDLESLEIAYYYLRKNSNRWFTGHYENLTRTQLTSIPLAYLDIVQDPPDIAAFSIEQLKYRRFDNLLE